MILITVKAKVDPVLQWIDRYVQIGMQNGAQEIAIGFVNESRKILESKVRSSGGKFSGKLSGAIMAKRAQLGLKTVARYDIIVDTARAPYAAWIEYGRRASMGIPYSQKGGRDYRKSKFMGHEYLSGALRKYKEGGLATSVVASNIIKALLGRKGRTSLTNL